MICITRQLSFCVNFFSFLSSAENVNDGIAEKAVSWDDYLIYVTSANNKVSLIKEMRRFFFVLCWFFLLLASISLRWCLCFSRLASARGDICILSHTTVTFVCLTFTFDQKVDTPSTYIFFFFYIMCINSFFSV
jgi:hypothetical protein